MASLSCPFPQLDYGSSSSCTVNNYLGLLVPAVSFLVSIAAASLSITPRPRTRSKYAGYEPAARDEDEYEDEDLETVFEGTRSERYIAFIPPLVSLVELVGILADMALAILLLCREVLWSNSMSALSSIYLFALVAARKFSPKLHAHLQPHSVILYGVAWLCVAGRLYAASIAQAEALVCSVLIARLVLLAGLCLIHLAARRAPASTYLSGRWPVLPTGPGTDDTASLLSRLTFTWIYGLIWKAYRTSLEASDLYPLNHNRKASVVLPAFRATAPDRDSLVWRMFLFCRKDLLRQGAWTAVASVGVFVPSVLIRRILEYLQSPGDTPRSTAWLLAAGLLASGLATGIAECQADWIGQNIVADLRAALVSRLCVKILRKRIGKPPQTADRRGAGGAGGDDDASKAAENEEASDGTILNLVSVDANAVSSMGGVLQLIWVTFPVQTGIGAYLLYTLLGISGLIGVLLMVLLLPMNFYLSKQLAAAEARVLQARDSRMQEANEVLQNIRTIKMMAWEVPFRKRVLDKRGVELRLMRISFVWWSIGMTVFYSLPFIVTILTLSFYTVVFGNHLGTTVAFPALAIFAVLRIPLDRLSACTNALITAHVSLVRIEKFMNEQETGKYIQLSERGHGTVGFSDASLTWPTGSHPSTPEHTNTAPDVRLSSLEFTLKNLDMEFPRGALSIICGASGSGKSSLLLALLGEMNLVRGRVFLSPEETGPSSFGSFEPKDDSLSAVAYCPQEAWIMNQSIRDNILMASPFDGRRYAQVLQSVALIQDIADLDHGDETLAGENGSRLSGGQKQRVALARALYSQAKCILLDDCLSALDSRTAKHVFFQAIKGPLMEGRTCILATHHTQLTLPHSDFVVLLEGGRVRGQGSPKELEATGLVDMSSTDEGDETPGTSTQAKKPPEPRTAVTVDPSSDRESTDTDEEAGRRKPKAEYRETKSEGAVPWSTIIGYLRAAGNPIYWFVVLAGFGAQQLASLGTNLWIKEWAHQYDRLENGERESLSARHYLGIYAAICGSYALISFMRDMTTFHGSLKASSRIYQQLLDAILYAKLIFFDSVPLGQITNRFSQDVEVVDQQLATFCVSALQIAATLLMVIGLISTVLPAFLLVACVITLMACLVTAVYVNGARDLKRIFSMARSPLYQQVGESLAGFVSIRAYGLTDSFMEENGGLLDGITQPFLLLAANKNWLTFNVNVLSSIISFATGAFVVWQAGFMDPGAAGLALTYAASFTESVLWFVQIYSIIQQNLTSLERVVEYTETEQEAAGPLRQLPEGSAVPRDWPARGGVRFDAYTTRYAPGLEPVLRSVSFEARPGERVAVVGRTGAGKSTLALALVRGLEADAGAVYVDGVDVAAVPLRRLRAAVTVVPQDPRLFAGSVRANLDPLGRHADGDVAAALRALGGAHLLLGADADDGCEGGDGDGEDEKSGLDRPAAVLSRGQRQMLCLARGLLRQSRVVVLDEATASVDHVADAAIQAGLRAGVRAAGTTVIAVAHRLLTVADYDRVIVLDAGRVAEQGHPAHLLARRGDGAVFRRLCEESGDLATIEQVANANMPAVREDGSEL